MRQIASICRYLTEKSHCPAGLFICAVQARLLYFYPCRSSCHSYWMAPGNTKQCSQTCPPKIKIQHATLLLKQLYWLPIQTCIDHKFATLAFRHFDGSLPQYPSSMLDMYQPSRSLRSCNDRLLSVPRWKLKSLVYRSFSYQRPVVWTSLTTDLKFRSSLASFKSNLKHICSRSPIHYVEITVTDVIGHSAMLEKM